MLTAYSARIGSRARRRIQPRPPVVDRRLSYSDVLLGALRAGVHACGEFDFRGGAQVAALCRADLVIDLARTIPRRISAARIAAAAVIAPRYWRLRERVLRLCARRRRRALSKWVTASYSLSAAARPGFRIAERALLARDVERGIAPLAARRRCPGRACCQRATAHVRASLFACCDRRCATATSNFARVLQHERTCVQCAVSRHLVAQLRWLPPRRRSCTRRSMSRSRTSIRYAPGAGDRRGDRSPAARHRPSGCVE